MAALKRTADASFSAAGVQRRTHRALFREQFGSTLEFLFTKPTKQCKAGRGGDGVVEYAKPTRRRFIGPGRPAGGRGGRGGDVVLRVNPLLSGFDGASRELLKLEINQIKTREYLEAPAQNGRPGKGKHIDGIPGNDLVLEVPSGCLLYSLNNSTTTDPGSVAESDAVDASESNQKELSDDNDSRLIEDLTEKNAQFIVAHGGLGGRGNTKEDPHHCTPGTEGETRLLRLVLKCLADVGLVGHPNAGKSTLLGSISQARPRISPEPFSTRTPQIGTIKFNDDSVISVADLPGIIQGAHANLGCGIRFLQQAERTKVLAFVIDMANQVLDPCVTFFCLRNEVVKHSPTNLAKKPFVVVANKCDMRPGETLVKVDELWRAVVASHPGVEVIPISARFGDGTSRLVATLKQVVESDREKEFGAPLHAL